MTDSITFADFLRTGIELVRENSIISGILTFVGAIVIFFFIQAIVTDFVRAFKEYRFTSWLKKDGNFTKFSTERDARKGYRRHLEERRYERKTRRWRKKYEGKSVSLAEKYGKLCEWFGNLPDMNDIRNAFRRLKTLSQGKAE